MRQFLLYCVFGGLGVLCDYSTYLVILGLGVGYQVANGIGYLTGTLVSFVLNRSITFRTPDRVILRLTLFIGVAALGFLTSSVLLWFLIDFIGLDARLAKLATLPVVVALQFTLNRFITFRSDTRQPAPGIGINRT